MRVILDASAAVRLVTGSDEAGRIRASLTTASTVAVPDLYVSEVTNALWKLARFADLPAAQADVALRDALSLPDSFVSTRELAPEVLALAQRFQRPAYDLFYLVAARREAARLVTLDRRLAELAAALGVDAL